jgi:hypothetical protein
MATEVSICSNAMLRLGGAPISSFDEAQAGGANIEQVRLAANIWPTVRQAVLREHVWNCTLVRALLSPDGTPPAFGFAYRFLLPSDWLRTLQVGTYVDQPLEYRTEGRYLVSDENALPLIYQADNKVPNSYDSALIELLEIAMAAAMCYAVTKSSSLRDSLNAEFSTRLKLARSLDGQDDPPQTFGDYPLYSSRFGGFPAAR